MKKIIVLSFVFLSFIAKAQEEVSVEKSLNSVQAGLFSLSYQNEVRLERLVSLRSEIGLMTGSSNIEYPDGQKVKSFLVVPFVNVEPRWYYSLDRRKKLGKITENNSANYFSLFTSFESAGTAIVNTKDLEVAPCIKIVPEYGLRRGFGKKWFSEYSVGIGYRHNFFKKDYFYSIAENQLYFDLQYKIGYIF
ncbi:MAG: hypothetical protein RIR01_1420 [Bacteroidota bacterium]|jgi:hypothetical protein